MRRRSPGLEKENERIFSYTYYKTSLKGNAIIVYSEGVWHYFVRVISPFENWQFAFVSPLTRNDRKSKRIKDSFYASSIYRCISYSRLNYVIYCAIGLCTPCWPISFLSLEVRWSVERVFFFYFQLQALLSFPRRSKPPLHLQLTRFEPCWDPHRKRF